MNSGKPYLATVPDSVFEAPDPHFTDEGPVDPQLSRPGTPGITLADVCRPECLDKLVAYNRQTGPLRFEESGRIVVGRTRLELRFKERFLRGNDSPVPFAIAAGAAEPT